MKILLFAVFVGLLGVESSVLHAPGRARRASAPGDNRDREASVLRKKSQITADGFTYEYETDNGISQHVTGAVEDKGIAVQGKYTYTAPDGTPIEVNYTADDEGFKPVADHLPVPPPIPDAIQRSLEYIAEHPPPVEPSYRKQ